MAALAVRLALYAAGGLWAAGPADPVVLQGDAIEYHGLARALADEGRFAFDRADPVNARRRVPWEIEPLRTPGYPAFVAAAYAVAGPRPGVPLALQLLLDAATCLLLAAALRGPLGARTAGLAALAYALHPGAALFANTLYSEPLFAFVCVSAFAVLARGWDRPGRRGVAGVAAAGALFGLAALVRPVLQFLPVAFGLYALWALRGSWRRALVLTAAFAVAFVLPLAPWAARNAAKHGHAALSTSGSFNLLMLYATPAEAVATGRPAGEVLDDLLARAEARARRDGAVLRSDFDRAPYWRAEALRVIAARRGAFVVEQGRGVARLFVSAGRLYRGQVLGDGGGRPPVERGPAALARWWAAQPPVHRALDGWVLLYYALVYPLLLVGIVAARRGDGRARHALGLSAALALYLVVMTGTPGHSRFMAPIVPFWAPFAALGAERLRLRAPS